MSNISAAHSISSWYPVTSTLFAPSSNPVSGNAIHYLPPPEAKVQCSYHRSGHISPTTIIGTTPTIPDLYNAIPADGSANYNGNEYSPCNIPSGL